MADVKTLGPLAQAWRPLPALAAFLLLIFALPQAALGADPDTAAEQRIKAAYLMRFASYVQWPDAAFAQRDSPLVIAVLGREDVAADLAQLVAGRTIEGRRVEVVRSRDEVAAGSHMVFVGGTRGTPLADVIDALPKGAVLLVTEAPGALKRGSAINFLVDDGQVRFEVSPEAAEKRGLKMSSRLIGVSHNLSGRAR